VYLNLVLFDSEFKIFFHFWVALGKTINMEVVQHLELYKFYFRKMFN